MLPGLVDELLAVLLERRDGVEGELIVRGYFLGRTGDDEWGYGFVCLDEVFDELFGYDDKVGLEVFGVLDHELRVDDCGERFV